MGDLPRLTTSAYTMNINLKPLLDRIDDSIEVTELNNRLLNDISIQLRELNGHLRDQKSQAKLAKTSGLIAPDNNGPIPPGYTRSLGPG
jgi:hypothetical protein